LSSKVAPPADSEQSLWRVLLMALRGGHHDYTSGSMQQALVLLAAPMMLEMFAQSLLLITSVFWVSKIGSGAVAVVGLTEVVMSLVYAFSVGMSFAAGAFVARRIGEGGHPDAAARGVAQAVMLGWAISLTLGFTLWLFGERVLLALGAAPDIAALGAPYVKTMFLGNVTVFTMFLLNAILRGCGDPAYSMRTLWLVNIVNFVVTPCLIFGVGPFPALGLTGVAIAIIFSRSVGVAFQFWRLTSGKGRLKLRLRHFVPVGEDMRKIAQMSWSGIAQMVISNTSGLGLFSIAALSGTVALAGATIAMRIVQFVMLPGVGIAFAAATLVGQNLGAGRPERASDAIRIATRMNIVFLSVLTVVLLVMARPIAMLFTTQPDVVREATIAIRIVVSAFPLYAAAMSLEAAFNGAGDTWTPALINFVCLWCTQIPLAWVLSTRFGLGTLGVYISVPVSFTLMMALTAWLYKRGRWKTHVI